MILSKQPFLVSLEQILESFEIRSSSSYIFNGNVYTVKKSKRSVNLTPEKSSPLVKSIQLTFYHTLHCKNIDFANGSMRFSYDIERRFVDLLSQANSSNGMWEYGWEIMEIKEDGNDKTIKVKNGDDMILYQDTNQFRTFDGQFEVGKKGSIFMPKEMRHMSYGFYTAIGNTSDEYPSDIVVRMYWNINSSGAPILLKHITTELNTADIPFQFKTLSNPFDYKRTDAAVLYIKKKYLQQCSNQLLQIYEKIKNFLKSETSLFVKKIYPGIGIAEDISESESFGENRTRILAEAISTAKEKSRKAKCMRADIDKIISYYQNSGVDIYKPYLNAQSSDNYNEIFPKSRYE